jgi:hypothetical protein
MAKTQKRPKGRPELADGEGRKRTFRIRMNDDELSRVKAKAQLSGLQPSTWARVELLKLSRE